MYYLINKIMIVLDYLGSNKINACISQAVALRHLKFSSQQVKNLSFVLQKRNPIKIIRFHLEIIKIIKIPTQKNMKNHKSTKHKSKPNRKSVESWQKAGATSSSSRLVNFFCTFFMYFVQCLWIFAHCLTFRSKNHGKYEKTLKIETKS